LLPKVVKFVAQQQMRDAGEKMLHTATSSYIQLHKATFMSSNIRLEKTCNFCGNHFTAKTTVTQFCSDNCAKRAYKQRKRSAKIETAIQEEKQKVTASFNPVVVQKDFLSIDETCQLLGASRWTIYRLIDKGQLKAGKLGSRTIISRVAIDNLFNTSVV
jgi:excisionase family DNA binding protein